MIKRSILKKITDKFSGTNDHLRVSLEIRPDGIAWAEASGTAVPGFGFEDCRPAKRAQVLQDLVGKRGWTGTITTLVLPLDQYQVFQMDRPDGIDESELGDALRWKLKDLLDFSPTDAVSDVFPFPEDASRGRGELVNVVAARKSLVSELVALVNDSGLKLECVDIAELALRNLVSRLEGLCKPLQQTVLVSDAVAAETKMPLVALGTHELRGIARPCAVFTLPER